MRDIIPSLLVGVISTRLNWPLTGTQTNNCAVLKKKKKKTLRSMRACAGASASIPVVFTVLRRLWLAGRQWWWDGRKRPRGSVRSRNPRGNCQNASIAYAAVVSYEQISMPCSRMPLIAYISCIYSIYVQLLLQTLIFILLFWYLISYSCYGTVKESYAKTENAWACLYWRIGKKCRSSGRADGLIERGMDFVTPGMTWSLL